MKKCALFLAVLLLSLSLTGCTASTEQTMSFSAMDTVITVKLYGMDFESANTAFSECRNILTELEALWSATIPNSDFCRINEAAAGEILLDFRTIALLRLASEVQTETDGAFDISLAAVSALWKRCETENRLPAAEELTELLSHSGNGTWELSDRGIVKTDPSLCLDAGGIGKGAAADALLAYLKTTSATGGMISFGSNVVCFGQKTNGSAFRIAVKDPKDPGSYAGIVTLSADTSLSVSGDYERYVEIDGTRYHHILDPMTGYSCNSGLSSVAILCESGALADALSTACMVLGYDAAMELQHSQTYRFEAIFLFSDGSVRITDGLRECWSATGSDLS